MGFAGPVKRNWSEIKTIATPTTNRRLYGSGVLFTTGVLVLSTSSSEDWHYTLRSSTLDAATGVAKFFVDGQLVAVRAVPHGTEGGNAFRLTAVKGGKTKLVTLYLHGVFAEHPELRPAGKCRVAVTGETDEEGVPYLVINLQSQLALRTTSRTRSRNTSRGAADRHA